MMGKSASFNILVLSLWTIFLFLFMFFELTDTSFYTFFLIVQLFPHVWFTSDYFLGTAKVHPWRLVHDQIWGIHVQEKFYLQIRMLLFELNKNM